MEAKQSTQVTQHNIQVVPIPFSWELISLLLLLLDFVPFTARYSLLEYPSGSPEVSVLSPIQKAISLCVPLTTSPCPVCLHTCQLYNSSSTEGTNILWPFISYCA